MESESTGTNVSSDPATTGLGQTQDMSPIYEEIWVWHLPVGDPMVWCPPVDDPMVWHPPVDGPAYPNYSLGGNTEQPYVVQPYAVQPYAVQPYAVQPYAVNPPVSWGSTTTNSLDDTQIIVPQLPASSLFDPGMPMPTMFPAESSENAAQEPSDDYQSMPTTSSGESSGNAAQEPSDDYQSMSTTPPGESSGNAAQEPNDDCQSMPVTSPAESSGSAKQEPNDDCQSMPATSPAESSGSARQEPSNERVFVVNTPHKLEVNVFHSITRQGHALPAIDEQKLRKASCGNKHELNDKAGSKNLAQTPKQESPRQYVFAYISFDAQLRRMKQRDDDPVPNGGYALSFFPNVTSHRDHETNKEESVPMLSWHPPEFL
ncbi:hypothetical protein QBC44DRAFT_119888 [Cladorrhinum sp. PSN332]|nr:hypothetical protein QBC44DRAFT_119888 [Cladorrhinum sp. PSN332]